MEILWGFRAGFSVPSVGIRMGMWIEIQSHSALEVLDDYCAIKIDLLTYLLAYHGSPVAYASRGKKSPRRRAGT